MTVFSLRPALLLLLLAGSPGLCLAQSLPTTASGRFEVLDRNGDGVVSKLEYNSDSLFSAIDSDRNNRISEQELQAIFGPQADGWPSAADRIRVADSNGDGELNNEELRRNIETRFHALDSSQDDNVDLAELKSGFGRP